MIDVDRNGTAADPHLVAAGRSAAELIGAELPGDDRAGLGVAAVAHGLLGADTIPLRLVVVDVTTQDVVRDLGRPSGTRQQTFAAAAGALINATLQRMPHDVAEQVLASTAAGGSLHLLIAPELETAELSLVCLSGVLSLASATIPKAALN